MKRLSRIKKEVDNGRIPNDVQRLIDEFYISDQIVGEEWSIREISEKINRKESATRRLMDEKVRLGTWKSRTAKLANGHIGIVYYEVKK